MGKGLMQYPEYIFVTGVPGSQWTSFTETLCDTGEFNITDRNDKRQYYHHGGARHLGSFFGQDMEFPAKLDKENLDAPFTDKNGTKFLCSHEWALMLPEIKQRYPDAWIMLIYRPNVNALQWWSEAGGFNIQYPNYNPYKDSDGMARAINEQNQKILEFGLQHEVEWHHPSNKFYKTYFNRDLLPPPKQIKADILATVIQ